MPSATKRPALLDTNLLLSAVDPREQADAALASRIVDRILVQERAVLSVQIIVEFFDNITRSKRGLAPALSKNEAAAMVSQFLQSCRCLDLTPISAFLAMQACQRYQMRVFDAHVWATAHLNGIDLIVTRDMPSQPVIEGIQYVNPFDPAFTFESIGL